MPVPLDHVVTDRVSIETASPRRSRIRIGLLGLGQVGTAFARLVHDSPAVRGRTFEIGAALVRETGARPRPAGAPAVTSPAAVFHCQPDVIVEALGDLEPARTLVLEAIARGIPVVTANKALLAHHGSELADAARAAAVPLFYEASVVAGVPFLGPLDRRPVLASSFASLAGIVNGTTNYVLSAMAATGAAYDEALADACRRGFAEPDPSKDVSGTDALEKLVVLLRHFGVGSVDPTAIEAEGIAHLTAADHQHARQLGGVIKPIIAAQWPGDGETPVEAFCSPAFVPFGHQLSHLDGVANGVVLRDRAGSDFLFAGPGAGPDVTAVTLLDDVIEATAGSVPRPGAARMRTVRAPATAWLVRIHHTRHLPSGAAIADLLAGSGVWIARASGREVPDGESLSFLTLGCSRARIDAATAAIARATNSEATVLRALAASDTHPFDLSQRS